MKLNDWKPLIRKWSRIVHRDLSYFFAGMLLIYAISGIVMNHRSTINPNYTVERKVFQVEQTLPPYQQITKKQVVDILVPLHEEKNYTKHYFPQPGKMKVFLKGGSNLYVDFQTHKAVYEKLTRRWLIGSLTSLHYNPGRWWTHFADIFAVALIIITLTGVIMVKGPKGLWGRGGIEMLIGILIPLLFFML